MSLRTHLSQAQVELLSAKRRAEQFNYSNDLIYKLEVLLRATSRVKEQAEKEGKQHGKSHKKAS